MAHTNRFGLVDQDISQFDRSQGRQAQLQNLLTQTQSGVQRGSAAVGFGIGSLARKAVQKAGFFKSKEQETAEQVSKAQGRAQSVFKGTPSELRAKGSHAQAIQEREILVEELKADGLDEQADTVRTQILALMEQQSKFAKLTGEVALQDEKLRQQAIETKQRILDKGSKDKLTRFLNEQESLDLTDPEQAVRFDTLGKAINKLTTITGTTEFDKPFDEITVRNLDKSLGETVGALDGFQRAKQDFDPKFLTLKGHVTNWAYKAAEIAGLDVGPDVKQAMREYSQFRQVTSTNLNAYIKAITGAQMSNPEALRLANDVPTINDSPTTYQAKLDDIIIRLSAVRERTLAALAASGDPEEFRRIRATSITEWIAKGQNADEDKLNQEADEILTRLEAALSGGQ